MSQMDAKQGSYFCVVEMEVHLVGSPQELEVVFTGSLVCCWLWLLRGWF